MKLADLKGIESHVTKEYLDLRLQALESRVEDTFHEETIVHEETIALLEVAEPNVDCHDRGPTSPDWAVNTGRRLLLASTF